MVKFDNYVYYSICEVSIPLVTKSFYGSYANWCGRLSNSIKLKQLSTKEQSWIIAIADRLELFYALEPELIGQYIADYFHKQKYLDFEQPVRLMNMAFKNSLH